MPLKRISIHMRQNLAMLYQHSHNFFCLYLLQKRKCGIKITCFNTTLQNFFISLISHLPIFSRKICAFSSKLGLSFREQIDISIFAFIYYHDSIISLYSPFLCDFAKSYKMIITDIFLIITQGLFCL